MSSDVINLAIEGGKKILCVARGRPAIILSMSVSLGIVIITREIYLKNQRSNGDNKTRMKKS